uniref:Uncharacterized protein n=1 Tax=Anguilla anguilla TaxID=7936 RepID=A0A0E9QHS2_ANGAN
MSPVVKHWLMSPTDRSALKASTAFPIHFYH